MHTTRDYYAELGVSPHATAWDIRKAYFILSLRYHFDDAKRSDVVGRFGEIEEAYYVLSNRSRRAAYDSSRYAAPIPPEITTHRRHQRWQVSVTGLLIGSVYGGAIGVVVGRITRPESIVGIRIAIAFAILVTLLTSAIILSGGIGWETVLAVIRFKQAQPAQRERLFFGLLGAITASVVGVLAGSVLLERGIVWIILVVVGGIGTGYLIGIMVTRVLLRQLFGRGQRSESHGLDDKPEHEGYGPPPTLD